MKSVLGKKRVLFICTHNSARSQIAEGFLKGLHGERYEAYSAGTQPSTVNPYAIKVMAEIGIDISKQRAKSVNEFLGVEFDYVITVCNHAKETCPFFSGAKNYLHQGFTDPSHLKGNEDEILNAFRYVRDEIRDWLVKTFGDEKTYEKR